ncbi:multidrug resistance protein MDR [Gigaspora margarita]|uniref:Multidrug resistance protein MDR n=1 Tax=Gigaspora margarita TaxID=4874 RepID=A0A8H4AGR2_GIGMA|nr:multidrug resistance protein MDR [Gigaspora margarita]
MTIKENIIFEYRPEQQATQEDVENTCYEANIHDFIIGLPDSYDTHIGRKGMQLLATSILDSGSEIAVQKALNTAAAGRTTLAITHRLSTIQHVDVIFVIKDNKAHEQGTQQELLSRKGIYYTMIKEQNNN